MPEIELFDCDSCDFSLPAGWGRHLYAIVPATGERVICAHPGEDYEARQITGLEAETGQSKNMIGVLRDCFCCDCVSQFQLDFERDPLICPSCRSYSILSTEDAIGHPCPKCKKGSIIRDSTGIYC